MYMDVWLYMLCPRDLKRASDSLLELALYRHVRAAVWSWELNSDPLERISGNSAVFLTAELSNSPMLCKENDFLLGVVSWL